MPTSTTESNTSKPFKSRWSRKGPMRNTSLFPTASKRHWSFPGLCSKKGYVHALFRVHIMLNVLGKLNQMKETLYDRELLDLWNIHRLPLNTSHHPATDDEDWTNDYPISQKYKDNLDDIAPRWRATPLPAFDSSGGFIKIPELEHSLRGSLVLVYFELRHYPIKNKKANGIAGNTFSATATQVKVLERGAERRSSPYKSLLLKGPILLPQLPTAKKDQENAVQAFHPGMNVSLSLKPWSDFTRSCQHKRNECWHR